MLSLPADLQDLFQQIPENFEHGDQLFFRKDYCVSSKKSGDKFRYWLADTGEEVSVNWHSFDGQIGILTARWGALPRPVILGKDPSYTRQGFKPWKGVGIGFGPNDDDRNLVVKAQGKPDWVDQVRHHGASFDNTVLGKRSERSWESEAGEEPSCAMTSPADIEETLVQRLRLARIVLVETVPESSTHRPLVPAVQRCVGLLVPMPRILPLPIPTIRSPTAASSRSLMPAAHSFPRLDLPHPRRY